MTKIIDRGGKTSALSAAENDANLSSLAGINEPQTGDYTIVLADQNRTIEFSKATAIAVTLPAVATVTSGIHTDDFKVTLKNINDGLVTVTSAGAFDDGRTVLYLARGESVTIQTDNAFTGWNIIAETGSEIIAFTPTIIGSGTAGTATYSSRNCDYHKQGKYVEMSINILLTGLGGAAGNIRVSNLPFTFDTDLASYSSAILTAASGLATGDQVFAKINATYIDFVYIDVGGGDAAPAAITEAHLSATSDFYFKINGIVA